MKMFLVSILSVVLLVLVSVASQDVTYEELGSVRTITFSWTNQQTSVITSKWVIGELVRVNVGKCTSSNATTVITMTDSSGVDLFSSLATNLATNTVYNFAPGLRITENESITTNFITWRFNSPLYLNCSSNGSGLKSSGIIKVWYVP